MIQKRRQDNDRRRRTAEHGFATVREVTDRLFKQFGGNRSGNATLLEVLGACAHVCVCVRVRVYVCARVCVCVCHRRVT